MWPSANQAFRTCVDGSGITFKCPHTWGNMVAGTSWYGVNCTRGCCWQLLLVIRRLVYSLATGAWNIKDTNNYNVTRRYTLHMYVTSAIDDALHVHVIGKYIRIGYKQQCCCLVYCATLSLATDSMATVSMATLSLTTVSMAKKVASCMKAKLDSGHQLKYGVHMYGEKTSHKKLLTWFYHSFVY